MYRCIHMNVTEQREEGGKGGGGEAGGMGRHGAG